MTRQALGRDPLSGEVLVRIVVDREVSVYVNGRSCGRVPPETPREEGSASGEIVQVVRGKAKVASLRWRPLP